MTGVDEGTLERLRTQGDQPEPLIKLCEVCGTTMAPHPKRGLARFAKQRCCSQACAGVLRSRELPGPSVQMTCEWCGDVFEVPSRRRYSLASRRACGKACANRLINRDRSVRAKETAVTAATVKTKPVKTKPVKTATPQQPETKECVGCAVTFRRPKGISHREWAGRRFCTARCGQLNHRRVELETRRCANPTCGRTFTRPPRCGDARWEVRRFCDQQCAVTAAHARVLDWHADAACRGSWVDPELFFPVAMVGKFHDEQVAAAKRVCSGCPVRAQCLEWALACDDAFAILGGLTAEERRRLLNTGELVGVAS